MIAYLIVFCFYYFQRNSNTSDYSSCFDARIQRERQFDLRDTAAEWTERGLTGNRGDLHETTKTNASKYYQIFFSIPNE